MVTGFLMLVLVVHRHDRHLHPCLLGVQENRERWNPCLLGVQENRERWSVSQQLARLTDPAEGSFSQSSARDSLNGSAGTGLRWSLRSEPLCH